MKTSRLFGAICIFTLSFTGTATAAVLVPADLLPGDTYQLAFVTSSLTTADYVLISDYNDIVQNLAVSAGLAHQGITWTVIGSTSTVNAWENAPISAPVYNMIGERVANGFDDMWDGSLANPINYTENGVLLSGEVWTGSTILGTPATLDDVPVSLGSASVSHGNSNLASSAWVYDAGIQGNNTQNSLYALSSPIIVSAIPLPPAVYLFGSGLLGLIGISRRKKVA